MAKWIGSDQGSASSWRGRAGGRTETGSQPAARNWADLTRCGRRARRYAGHGGTPEGRAAASAPRGRSARSTGERQRAGPPPPPRPRPPPPSPPPPPPVQNPLCRAQPGAGAAAREGNRHGNARRHARSARTKAEGQAANGHEPCLRRRLDQKCARNERELLLISDH